MKRSPVLLLLLITLFSLSLSGCKDSNDEDASPKTNLLTNSEWKGDAIYAGPFRVMDLLKQFGQEDLAAQADISDWKFKFDKNGTVTATRDGVSDKGKWKFLDNETKLQITSSDNEETTLVINTLSESKLNLEFKASDLGFDPQDLQGFSTFEVRFVK